MSDFTIDDIQPCEKNNSIELKKIKNQTRVPNTSKTSMSNKGGGKNISIMLIAVVFFFFICQFPNLIVHIIQSMVCTSQPTNFCTESSIYKYSLVVCKFLLICNLSFNFAFYCLFSQKFREVFKETFKRK